MGENVIELNGKRYDAITGAYLRKSNVVPKHITEQYVHGRVIDGFVRPAHPARRTASKLVKAVTPALATKTAATQQPKAQTSKASTEAPRASKPVHIQAHSPQKAKTLMQRHARKPNFTIKPAIKTQAPAEIMAKPSSAIMHKRSAYGIDPSRRDRAALANQHQAVQHFQPQHRQPARHSVVHVPAISVRPMPIAAAKPKPTAQHTDIFEKAIASASSHEQPAHKPRTHRTRRRRMINSLAAVAAVLVVVGFVAYLNMPRIELQVASVQAGFGASMPAYTPTGYALQDGVKRSGGTVSLRFRSGDSSYTITQQSSNWNSQTLLDNTLALGGSHETVQRNGQTIYVYDDSTRAAWVNGGVRYDINGNAQLSTDDIVAIAASL